MYDVVALGELLIDFSCVSVGEDNFPTLAAHPGGAPANFLATLGSLGAKTAMIGKVGEDGFGKLLVSALAKYGIDTKGVILDPNVFTTLAFVTLDAAGEREFSFARKPGADTRLSFSEIDLSLIENARVMHFGSLSFTDEPSATACREAVRWAKQKGCIISYDPNLRIPLWKEPNQAARAMEWGLLQADIVKISDDELRFLWSLSPEEGADKLVSEYGVELVFVTCGAEGCVYRNKNFRGRQNALTGVNVVDTTGAGDIFGGSVMYKILENGKQVHELTKEELDEMVHFAVVCAGLSTERSGGISSIPGKEEIDHFV